jgi:hypothetical protein
VKVLGEHLGKVRVTHRVIQDWQGWALKEVGEIGRQTSLGNWVTNGRGSGLG